MGCDDWFVCTCLIAAASGLVEAAAASALAEAAGEAVAAAAAALAAAVAAARGFSEVAAAALLDLAEFCWAVHLYLLLSVIVIYIKSNPQTKTKNELLPACERR